MNLHTFPEIMTLEEVAEYLRTSERTVANWAGENKIPAGKIGTAWRFRRDDVRKWVDSQIGSFSSGEKGHWQDALSLDRVLITSCNTKSEFLNTMIARLTEMPIVTDAATLSEGIYRREALMSTGIGMQIAIPHVRMSCVTDIGIAVALNTTDLSDYESIDGLPVRLAVMIIAREDQHADHLRLLSGLSRQFKDDDFRAALFACGEASKLYELLVNRLQG